MKRRFSLIKPAHITKRVKEWQSSPLGPVYYTVWMNGIMLKVKHAGKYRHAIQSWQKNWDNLTRYFDPLI